MGHGRNGAQIYSLCCRESAAFCGEFPGVRQIWCGRRRAASSRSASVDRASALNCSAALTIGKTTSHYISTKRKNTRYESGSCLLKCSCIVRREFHAELKFLEKVMQRAAVPYNSCRKSDGRGTISYVQN